jgi:hypothetical protein
MKDETQINSGYVPPLKPGEQNNYEIAYSEAAAILAESDINEIATRSGSQKVETDGTIYIILSFLNDNIVISYPDISIYYHEKDDVVPLWLKILVLHYLIYAKGTPPAGDQITFKQLEGGLGYYPAFQRRTTIPLLKTFNGDIEELIEWGAEVGGVKAGYGDYAITFQAFPKVAVTFVFWKGDSEFPPEGNVIFDSTIGDYFTTEDIAVLCNMIAVMIIKKSIQKG